MMVRFIEDPAWIRANYDNIVRPRQLVDQLDYKLASLSSEFSKVGAYVAYAGSDPTGLVLTGEIRGRTEILGQYWGEGHALCLLGVEWSGILEAIKGKIMMEYCATPGIEGMVEMEDKQAVLWLPQTDALRWYRELFQGNKKDRQIIAEAVSWWARTNVEVAWRATAKDIDTLTRFAFERLGAESRFCSVGFLESFVGVVGYLMDHGNLIVLTFGHEGKTVGNMFFMWEPPSLTYLSGFYDPKLSGFGKGMYYAAVALAEKFRAQEISAMMPVNRIKRIMKFEGRPLFAYYREG